MSLSRNAGAYCSSPRPRSHWATSMGVTRNGKPQEPLQPRRGILSRLPEGYQTRRVPAGQHLRSWDERRPRRDVLTLAARPCLRQARGDLGSRHIPRGQRLTRPTGGALGPHLCRFSDAGNDKACTRSGGRRLKSAKARNRGRWGTVGAAGSMGI
jgi:hypothetical protein